MTDYQLLRYIPLHVYCFVSSMYENSNELYVVTREQDQRTLMCDFYSLHHKISKDNFPKYFSILLQNIVSKITLTPLLQVLKDTADTAGS